MSIKKNSRKGTIGSDAQQKTEPATANSQRISRQQKMRKVIANRKPQKAKEAKRRMEAESPADQKAEHLTRGAVHKQQRQERFDRQRQSIIDSEDLTPPFKKPKKKVKVSAASLTDQSKERSNIPRARHTEEDPQPTNQTPPTPSPVTRRPSLDRLIETSPEAHKHGYRAIKYSYRLIHLTHTIQSENPGISVFDGVVEH